MHSPQQPAQTKRDSDCSIGARLDDILHRVNDPSGSIYRLAVKILSGTL